MDFNGNPWKLLEIVLEIIAGISLLLTIVLGDPDPWHYSVFAGDMIALALNVVIWVRDKYF